MTEFFEIFDSVGNPTGKQKKREDIHRDGNWHRTVHLHLIHPDHRIIFQLRSAAKDVCPNQIDVAVGGHLIFGESIQEARIREVREEVGIDLHQTPGELIIMPGYRVAVHDFPNRQIQDHELQSVAFFLSELRVDDLAPQPDEITAIMEFRIQDILDVFAGKSDQVSNTEGRCYNMEGKMVPYFGSWGKNDFVPGADHYFGKAAYLAQKILHGERSFPGI